jgi:hypothetical protein
VTFDIKVNWDEDAFKKAAKDAANQGLKTMGGQLQEVLGSVHKTHAGKSVAGTHSSVHFLC